MKSQSPRDYPRVISSVRPISYPHTLRLKERWRQDLQFLRGAIALTVVLVSLFCALVFTTPVLARFVPPRYVARFVPESLQGYFRSAPVELPMPSAAQASAPHAVASLLTPLPVLTRSPTTTPAPAGTPATPTSTPVRQSTPTSAPTFTRTPVSRVTATVTTVPFVPPTHAARATRASLESATVLLTGFRQTYQTWNNCGPANLTMALSYYGWQGTQAQAAAFLKPDPEDRNVSPDELASFARSQGWLAIVRVNGTSELLKVLLRAGFAPIVEKGFEPEPKEGWMGHYELLAGWGDTAREFIAMDSYLGANVSVPFDEMEKYWRQFNRTYLVVYKPEQAEALAKIIGADMDDGTMYRNALARAQAEVDANPKDAFGWFNVGSNFAALRMWNEAVAAYDQARRLGLPWRMTWYQFGWFEAYLAAGRLDDVIALADVTLKNNPFAEEMYLYKGLVLQKRGDENAAREQFALAVKRNPNYARARQAAGAGGP